MKFTCTALIVTLGLAFSGAASAAEPSRSAEPARRVTKLLDARGLQAFAAEDPKAPGRFVAALYFPGAQLLAISATYSAPALLRNHLAAADYRQVYVDLSTAGDRTGRLFVEDFGVPGLQATPEKGKPFDITWRDVTKRLHYDAAATAQKLSDSDYHSRFEADDAAYAEMLEILAAALTSSATPGRTATEPPHP
jgi:hypothetical protein